MLIKSPIHLVANLMHKIYIKSESTESTESTESSESSESAESSEPVESNDHILISWRLTNHTFPHFGIIEHMKIVLFISFILSKVINCQKTFAYY